MFISNPKAQNSKFGRYFKLDLENVNSLADLIISPPFGQSFFEDVFSWLSSLQYFPFDFKYGVTSSDGKLKLGNYTSTISCSYLNNDTDGFLMSKFLSPLEGYKFLNTEPYVSVNIFLPFYGVVELNSIDIIDKNIFVICNLDLPTGSLLYTLLSSKGDITVFPEAPSIKDSNIFELEDLLLIGQYNTQIGYEIPIGTTNATEVKRNIIASSINLGGQLIAGYAQAKTPTQTYSDTTSTLSQRNPSTGRMVQHQKVREISMSTKTRKFNPIPTTISAATSTLANIQIRAQMDKPYNAILKSINSLNPTIIIKRAKVKDRSDYRFNHLYGRPLGEIRELSKVNGYTEISEIHIEGDGFENITEDEREEIYSILTSGVILDGEYTPPEPEPNFQNLYIINYNLTSERYNFTMPENDTFEDFIGSEYDTSNGKLVINVNDNTVTFDGYTLFKIVSGVKTNISSTDVASGTIYYEGFIPPTVQTLRLYESQYSSNITATYNNIPYGYTFEDFINSNYNVYGYWSVGPNVIEGLPDVVKYKNNIVIRKETNAQVLPSEQATGDYYISY